jgi:hypothetical protein
MPTLDAGVAGLALPFLHDDGILFDPSFLDWPAGLRNVVARELAHLLYPRWIDLALEEEYDQMQEFGRVLAPRLLHQLPRAMQEVQPMVAAAMASS